jgi:hypothetical protein|mmetsp:Transcript_9258/g.22231  ORF Transcript_9258/g.22231 Transcript_9258/m.22231 type:complete len:141 (-) Transcript_9258:579-1001(-)
MWLATGVFDHSVTNGLDAAWKFAGAAVVGNLVVFALWDVSTVGVYDVVAHSFDAQVSTGTLSTVTDKFCGATSMVMLAKTFAGSDAVGEEDADELKRTQRMSKAVQQELGMLTGVDVVASTAARARTTALSLTTAKSSLI